MIYGLRITDYGLRITDYDFNLNNSSRKDEEAQIFELKQFNVQKHSISLIVKIV